MLQSPCTLTDIFTYLHLGLCFWNFGIESVIIIMPKILLLSIPISTKKIILYYSIAKQNFSAKLLILHAHPSLHQKFPIPFHSLVYLIIHNRMHRMQFKCNL